MAKQEKDIARRIIEAYLASDLPRQTEKEVKQWLVSKRRAGEKDEVLWNLWNEMQPAGSAGGQRALRKVRASLGMDAGVRRRGLLRLGAIAASLMLILASTVWIIRRHEADHEQPVTVLAAAIVTGENEIRHKGLEDGTKLWVNEESRVVYSDGRSVELEGEAFFEVEHTGEGFSVRCGPITATVTGTTFNVRSYPQQQSAVICLYEGSLTIEVPDTVIYLAAGRQFEYGYADRRIEVTEMARTRPDWMRDIINFEDAPIGRILQELEKIYGVRIDAGSLNATGDKLELKFEGGIGLEEVLLFMSEISGKFGYRIDGDKVYVYDID